jgi:hypothetical protein
VVRQVLQGPLAGDDGLDEEPEHGEHGEAPVLDLLHLSTPGYTTGRQRGPAGRSCLPETQRVDHLAERDRRPPCSMFKRPLLLSCFIKKGQLLCIFDFSSSSLGSNPAHYLACSHGQGSSDGPMPLYGSLYGVLHNHNLGYKWSFGSELLQLSLGCH